MKLPSVINLILFILIFTSSIVVSSIPADKQQAGTYWVNIIQTGSSSYEIKIEITAGESLEIGTVKVPEIMDASDLPGKMEVRPLSTEIFQIPVRFIAEGSGTLWVAVKSGDDAEKIHYFVFDIVNSMRGQQVKSLIIPSARLWSEGGGASSVMQFGSKNIQCDGSLVSGIEESGLFTSRNAVTGVVLKGSSPKLGNDVSTIDAQDWGLTFVRNRVGRVGSFSSTKTLAELPAEDIAERTPEKAIEQTNTRETSRQKPQTEADPQKAKSNRSTIAKNEIEKSTKPKKEEIIEPGPYSSTGPAATIENLPVNRNWSAEGGGSGHFGETVVILPAKMEQFKEIESIELVISVESQGSAPGNGRVAISSRRTLTSSPDDRRSYWLAHEYSSQGTPLGDFNTASGNEFRFDVTSWIETNPADRYFVRILNLSRVALRIENIRLEVSGIR